MDCWLYYEIFGAIMDPSSEPGPRHGLTSEGQASLVRIERRVARFYEAHRERVTGIYVFSPREVEALEARAAKVKRFMAEPR